ncbi:MAG: ChbG/HpnK family deacetylase [Bacteroidales bacterium]|nr:MAG: ChbG/HpnK family deacetylase [Bacteroidales bacterium]
MKYLVYVNILAIILSTNFSIMAGDKDDIRLIVRADDMGFSRAANLACIKGYKEGIITTVEVIVPGPWFLDAAKLLRDNPGLDAGVHLALTSEWVNYKWGPVTNAQSLVTEDMYFYDRTEKVAELELDPVEVEAELRAQIELAVKHIPQVSHISDHMNVAESHPAIKKIVKKLSREYKLPLFPEGKPEAFEMWSVPPEEKEDSLAEYLDSLKPGIWEIICHPALNNEETRGIEGSVYDEDSRMAIYREALTNALISQRIKDIIKQLNIRLVSYSDTYK